MRAPQIRLDWLKWIWMSLPNRLLLWFRSVLALPKASSTGLVWRRKRVREVGREGEGRCYCRGAASRQGQASGISLAC